VGKHKLKKWAEIRKFDFVIQPVVEDVFEKDHLLKGKWANFFLKTTIL